MQLLISFLVLVVDEQNYSSFVTNKPTGSQINDDLNVLIIIIIINYYTYAQFCLRLFLLKLEFSSE